MIKTIHVGFVVDKVALGQVSQVLCFSLANSIPPKLYTHLPSGAGKKGSFEGRNTKGHVLAPPPKK
jgi:hypothetical protein